MWKRFLGISTIGFSGFTYYHYKTNTHGYTNGLALGTIASKYAPTIHKFIGPEFGHRLDIKLLSTSQFTRRYILGLTDFTPDNQNLQTNLFGKKITNPIGIAAGFDKHGEAIDGLNDQGFGFVEIGSITPLPQPGNDRPRVFRLTEDRSIINRYGFNSVGKDAAQENIESASQNVVLGINLGKNKNGSTDDYEVGIKEFSPHADYLVINVSSPNTPGLRDLQHKTELVNLLNKCKGINNNKPLVLKISPDLTEHDLSDIAEAVLETKINGVIIGNTTTSRPIILQSKYRNEMGGLSGPILKDTSTELIRKFYKMTNGSVTIIGCGGIENATDAYDKILAGASAVQLYTAYAYNGPKLIHDMKKDLSKLVEKDGYKNIGEAVGKLHHGL